MEKYVNNLVRRAREASFKLATLDAAVKNAGLKAMAQALIVHKDFILEQNKKDLKRATAKKMQKHLVDRLTLNDLRIDEMARSLWALVDLPDPIGSIIKEYTRPNGMRIKKVRSPVGVILIVYEARPNVTSDCIGLLFKSSNVAILRGGSDALFSNLAIAKVLHAALADCRIECEPFFMVDKPGHIITDILLTHSDTIDLVIPRGGEALIRKVVESSNIPVIKHYKGVCHIFVDSEVDIDKAIKICVNAKVQRPSVCNAVEKILVHKDIAPSFLPLLEKEYCKHGVQIRADTAARKIIKSAKLAVKKDWFEEYLDLIITVGIVDNVGEAIDHINFYGSHHTDSILTKVPAHAARFEREVDSACCFVNISTRFSDGYEFGLGAEIGISTDKLHARGPMGLEELTTYKWIVEGDGQIRE